MFEMSVIIYGLYALAAIVAAVYIVIFGFSMRQGLREGEVESRRGGNQCLACGYRLKGNLSGVCPECGEAINHSAAGRAQLGDRSKHS